MPFRLINNMVQIEEYSTEGCEFELREDSGAGCVKESSFDEIEDTIMPERSLKQNVRPFCVTPITRSNIVITK